MHNTANVYLWGTHVGTILLSDECYAHNPKGDWTSRHQMSVNGMRIGITDDDILACARFANMRERKARAVLDEVKDAVREWARFAAEAEVPDELANAISRQLERSM